MTRQDAIDYIAFLSSVTAPLGLALGLKNAGDIIDEVLPVVHFSVNEECVKYDECGVFAAFVEAGKPVFHIEYPDGAGKGIEQGELERFCKLTGAAEDKKGFSTVLKKMELDGWVEYCDGNVVTTPVDGSSGGHGGK